MDEPRDSTSGIDLAELISARVGDHARLAAVATTGLLDTPDEPAFDRVARLDPTRQNDVGESCCQYLLVVARL